MESRSERQVWVDNSEILCVGAMADASRSWCGTPILVAFSRWNLGLGLRHDPVACYSSKGMGDELEEAEKLAFV